MADVLQRCLGPATALEPKQYTRRTASGDAAICCPSCGGIAELPKTHEPDVSGVVKYAWKCPTPTCPYLEFLILESYSEDVV